MSKEVSIPLILVLVVAISILGLSVYNQYGTEEIIQEEIIEEELVEEPIVEKPVIVEEPKEITVFISRFEFDKSEITIEPGTKVIWVNTDERRHMITNKRIGLFRTMRKSLEKGDTFEYTFNDPGTYEILEANFGINGKVIVENTNMGLVTGSVIGELEVNGANFLLLSINLFVITLLVLVIGFYVSRHKIN
jgi:plastocyanin|tara:strand:+ start:96 stop:671 length:576 start_codon:yes stop_codon:yes gene_type:complete